VGLLGRRRRRVVTVDQVALQRGKQRGRRTCAGLRVLVRRQLDGHRRPDTAPAASGASPLNPPFGGRSFHGGRV